MHRLFYWLTFGILAALLLAKPLHCQSTIPVTGHLGDSSQGVPPGMSVKFELYNCGANYPRAIGVFGIVRQNFTLTPDSTGLITGTIVPNDVINCGGVTGTTRYYVTPLLNNVPQIAPACYAVLSTMGTFNLDVATPCTSATPPPPPGGPFDATFNNVTVMGLLSGGSALFSGSFSAGSFHFLAAPGDCTSGNYSTGLDINFAPVCLPLPTVSIPVLSVFGRGSNVVAANGDYSCGMVTGAICSLPTLNYQTVQVSGTSKTQRSKLNFLSSGATTVTCADNSSANSTDCSFSSPPTGGTDIYWTFTTCNNMTGQPSQCTGSTTLPGTMPDASYQLFCQTNSGGSEPSDQVIIFHVAIPLPTASGSTLNYAMIQIFQNGTLGGVPVTAMCHAHHS